MTVTLSAPPVGLVGLAGHLKRHPLQDPGAITPAMLEAAQSVWLTVQREAGFKGDARRALLTPPDGNQKIAKSVRLVWSLTLSPAASSGSYNTCVRYADCEAVCVLTARYSSVARSREARTALLFRAPEAFAVLIAHELDRAAHVAQGADWGLRPNAASDIAWELAAPWMLERVRNLGGQSYDYTKAWGRTGGEGYRVVLSVDSRQDVATISAAVRAGRNVAVILPVKKGAPVPATWNGLPTIDGDVSDARCDDPSGVVVVLRAKGKLKGARGIGHPMVRAL